MPKTAFLAKNGQKRRWRARGEKLVENVAKRALFRNVSEILQAQDKYSNGRKMAMTRTRPKSAQAAVQKGQNGQAGREQEKSAGYQLVKPLVWSNL